MRIKQIEIKKLFGLYDHTIPLNLDERVTILYGVNGVGKTTLLKVLETIHGGKDKIIDFLFEYIKLHFEDNRTVARLDYKHKDLSIFEDNYGKFFNSIQPKGFNIKKILENYKIFTINQNAFCLDIHRVISFKNASLTIQHQANFFASQISAVNGQYARLSQQLDQTFPVRALQLQSSIMLKDVEKKLHEVESIQTTLQELNLFDHVGLENISLKGVDPSRVLVMSLYVEDMLKKLDLFKPLIQKMQLFSEIANRRLLNKNFKISRTAGYEIFDIHQNPIPLDKLSSGEQHQLVMLYQLIFEADDKTLVLIDEPETSLHLSWQREFLTDLLRIAQLNQFDAVVATHSPYIIDKYWNLTVELKADVSPEVLAQESAQGV